MIAINLLPPKIKTKISQAKQTASLISVGIVIFVAAGALALLLWAVKSQYLETTLEMTKGQIAKANDDLKNYKATEDAALFLNDRAKTAEKIEAKRPMWSQILQDLINAVPQTVQLVSVTSDLEKSPNFVLRGNTTSEREIIKFKEKLEASGFFKNVAFKSAAVAQSQDKTVSPRVDFSLEFDLEKLFIK